SSFIWVATAGKTPVQFACIERNLLLWQHGNIPAPLSITAPINGDRIQFMYIVYKTKNHDATGFFSNRKRVRKRTLSMR
ncbi:MAG TPA: hypothetical protein DCM48_12160, partial [Thalassospira sp.]|nr:hypothetical protein [Thalassospira sp.]